MYIYNCVFGSLILWGVGCGVGWWWGGVVGWVGWWWGWWWWWGGGWDGVGVGVGWGVGGGWGVGVGWWWGGGGWGGGGPVVACPSQALVVLYRMLTIFPCYILTYVWDAVSIFNHFPGMFLFTDFAFRITDWTSCHGPQYLHAILRIISKGVSGLATDSPCGVWGRGWTTCLLNDSPLTAHILKWELVCKFRVRFHISIIISCLGSRFHALN